VYPAGRPATLLVRVDAAARTIAGSGALVAFDNQDGIAVDVRVGISYVSDTNGLFHAGSHRGYVQSRRADGSWPPFDPASEQGFAEGSSAQYTWMVPFDPRGLFEAMGGTERALDRLQPFFRTPDAGLALTGLGGLHAELDYEPSTGVPWLYDYADRPDQTERIVREVMRRLWSDTPYGIPGNDDLGAMSTSTWYVWAALGMYAGIPGRAELLLGSPLFQRVAIGRGSGTLAYDLSPAPTAAWGRDPVDAPPSFPRGDPAQERPRTASEEASA
jgi:putative alpha-1,2-mannosidase